MSKKKRVPRAANLANLIVINSNDAYDHKGNLNKGVYGIVGKDVPFIFNNRKNRKTKEHKRVFVNDSTNLSNVCKERVMEFFDDKQNKRRKKCYLIDKEIYDKSKRSKEND